MTGLRRVLVPILAAVAVALIAVPASLANRGPQPQPPRGLWCNTSAVLDLPNPDAGSPGQPQFVTEGPNTAVNLVADQGKALAAAGLVNPAYLLPYLGGSWFGAFCPGFQSPRLAGVTITPVMGPDGKPDMVDMFGQQGDNGMIYQLVTAS